jgi:hypothetical protein
LRPSMDRNHPIDRVKGSESGEPEGANHFPREALAGCFSAEAHLGDATAVIPVSAVMGHFANKFHRQAVEFRIV